MSAEAVPVVASVREPSLSESILALLAVLGRGAPKGARVLVGPVGPGAIGPRSSHLAPPFSRELLPLPLLAVLEDYPATPHAIHCATTHGPSLDLASMSAIVVTFSIELIYSNPDKPGSKVGARWGFDRGALDALLLRLEHHSAPPSAVVVALPVVAAVWSLAAPLRLPADFDRARRVTAGLTKTLGGAPLPATWPDDATVPLPGCAAAPQQPQRARCVSLAPGRIYSADDLDLDKETK